MSFFALSRRYDVRDIFIRAVQHANTWCSIVVASNVDKYTYNMEERSHCFVVKFTDMSPGLYELSLSDWIDWVDLLIKPLNIIVIMELNALYLV